MVRVYNKKEKTTWEVTDEAILKRLSLDPMHYEVGPEKGESQTAGADPDQHPTKLFEKGTDKPVKAGK